MYDITLILTQHQACGNCSSMELQAIIEQIRPEVIFEELSISDFIESYEKKRLITLETNSIKEYLKHHNIKHVPVDTYPLPDLYFENLDIMYNKVVNTSTLYESYLLRDFLYI